jgi:hypothetical protein
MGAGLPWRCQDVNLDPPPARWGKPGVFGVQRLEVIAAASLDEAGVDQDGVTPLRGWNGARV